VTVQEGRGVTASVAFARAARSVTP